MRILHLTLKKKWFDMIASGEKKEEYRDIKEYWHQRLVHFTTDDGWVMRTFDTVRFKNGYSKSAPTLDIECKAIYLGDGNPEWGGHGNSFIIKLGKILSIKNYKQP